MRDLIALRLMLDDALQRVNVAHQYTRGSAVVALDAAVERVAYLVALRRGVIVGPRDGLGDLHSKLVQNLGKGWKSMMWPQVRHLHEARNGAQHRGLTPAAEDAPGWAAAARAYVTSLVRAEYDVDLDRLVLADAVRRGPLADLLRAAERSLSNGDIPSSVEASKQAFRAAVNWWSGMHGRDRHTPTAAFHPELGFMGDDRAGKAIGSLQRATTEASFASSSAEYEWFSSTCKEPVELLDADDAERMLAFTFTWIVSLEFAAEQWAPDRRQRADIAARRVRTTADHARIASILPVRHNPSFTEVTFELADVPGLESYDRWAEVLREVLGSPTSGQWRVAPDGAVTLTTHQGTLPRGADVDALVAALAVVEDAMEADHAHLAQAAGELDALRAERELEIDALRDALPDWVAETTFEDGRRLGIDHGWRVAVTPEVTRLQFPNSGTYPEFVGIWDIVRTEQATCLVLGAGEACFPLPASATDVVNALVDADQRVRERLIQIARERTAHQKVVADIQADLAAALAHAQLPD